MKRLLIPLLVLSAFVSTPVLAQLTVESLALVCKIAINDRDENSALAKKVVAKHGQNCNEYMTVHQTPQIQASNAELCYAAVAALGDPSVVRQEIARRGINCDTLWKEVAIIDRIVSPPRNQCDETDFMLTPYSPTQCQTYDSGYGYISTRCF